MEVRQEPLRDPKVAFQSSGLFVGIEGSSFSDHVDLRRLEATEDYSARLSEHTFSPVEAQAMCFSQ